MSAQKMIPIEFAEALISSFTLMGNSIILLVRECDTLLSFKKNDDVRKRLKDMCAEIEKVLDSMNEL